MQHPPYIDHQLDYPLDFVLDTAADVATFNSVYDRLRAMNPLIATDPRLATASTRPVSGGDVVTMNGTTQYITAPRAYSSTTDFDFEIVFKVIKNGSFQIVYDSRSSAGVGFTMNLNSGNKALVTVNGLTHTHTADLNDSLWHTIKVVYDGVNVVSTVDEGDLLTTAFTDSVTSIATVVIAARSFTSQASFFGGTFGHVIVTSSNGSSTYRLGETTGTTALDSSQLNGNDGTYVNSPTLNVPDNTVPFSAWNQLGGSERMYFDGSGDSVLLGSDLSFSGVFDISLTLVRSDVSASESLLGHDSSGSYLRVLNTGALVLRNDALVSRAFAVGSLVDADRSYTVRITRDGSDDLMLYIDGIDEGITSNLTGLITFNLIGDRSVADSFNGIIYDVDLNSEASYLGLNATNAGWEDQIGSNDGTVTGGSTIRIPKLEASPLDALGDISAYRGSVYPVIPNVTGGSIESLTAFNTNVADGGIQSPEILAAGLPATWIQADGSVPLLQLKDNGDATSSLALGFEDSPTAAEQLTIDKYHE